MSSKEIYDHGVIVNDLPRATTVLCNGCFDVLHVAHLRFLEEAARRAHRLIVALNTDESVRRLKGPGRPINKLEDRMELIAGLQCVDFVTFFEGDDVAKLIRTIRPTVWAKGSPWTPSTLKEFERDAARDVGTSILILEKFGDYSTTWILEKVKAVDTVPLPCANCGSPVAFNLEKAGPGALVCPECGSAMKV